MQDERRLKFWKANQVGQISGQENLFASWKSRTGAESLAPCTHLHMHIYSSRKFRFLCAYENEAMIGRWSKNSGWNKQQYVSGPVILTNPRSLRRTVLFIRMLPAIVPMQQLICFRPNSTGWSLNMFTRTLSIRSTDLCIYQIIAVQ